MDLLIGLLAILTTIATILAIGAVIGYIAGFFMRTKGSLLRHFIYGFFGSYVGIYLGVKISSSVPIITIGGRYSMFIFAVVGACIVIAVARILKIVKK